MNIWEPQPRAREGIRPQTLCGANDLEQFPRKVFREEFVIFRERGRKSLREKAVWPRRPDRQSCDGGGEERRSGGGTEAHACADRHGAKRKLRRRRRREAKKKNCDGLVKSFCIFGWTQANPLPQKADGTTDSRQPCRSTLGNELSFSLFSIKHPRAPASINSLRVCPLERHEPDFGRAPGLHSPEFARAGAPFR